MASIACKDFGRVKSGLLKLSTLPLQATIDEMNAWLSTNNVKVLNVETIFRHDEQKGAQCGFSEKSPEGIRVWYLSE